MRSPPVQKSVAGFCGQISFQDFAPGGHHAVRHASKLNLVQVRMVEHVTRGGVLVARLADGADVYEEFSLGWQGDAPFAVCAGETAVWREMPKHRHVRVTAKAKALRLLCEMCQRFPGRHDIVPLRRFIEGSMDELAGRLLQGEWQAGEKGPLAGRELLPGKEDPGLRRAADAQQRIVRSRALVVISLQDWTLQRPNHLQALGWFRGVSDDIAEANP